MQTRGFTLLVVVLAVSGGVLVYTQVFPYGAHLNTDSFSYLSAARSLLSGEGYLIFGGSGRTDLWPPIYPALLALASLVSGMDPLAVIDPFNAIIFGLTVLVLGRWLSWRLEHRPLMVWACLAALFIGPVFWIATHARSESLFILFTTLALSSADRFLKISGGGAITFTCGSSVDRAGVPDPLCGRHDRRRSRATAVASAVVWTSGKVRAYGHVCSGFCGAVRRLVGAKPCDHGKSCGAACSFDGFPMGESWASARKYI